MKNEIRSKIKELAAKIKQSLAIYELKINVITKEEALHILARAKKEAESILDLLKDKEQTRNEK